MRTRVLLVLALALVLAGCALWRRPLMPVRYYSIDPPALAPKAGAAGVLAVRSLASATRYRERILYRKGGAAAGYHEYDRWVETPAEMATTVLRRTLDAAGVATAVVDDRLVRRPDFLLDGRLTCFDEVHRDPHWAAECEIELVLKQADDNTVLLAARFAASREARSDTTQAFVEAMGAAVAEVAARAADAVAKALAARKPASGG